MGRVPDEFQEQWEQTERDFRKVVDRLIWDSVGRFEGDAGKPTVLYIDSPRPDDEQALRRALSEVARG